jgi:hypothetical protein
MEQINRIAKFPIFRRGNWAFSISITNQKNVLVIASKQKDDYDFLVRFFVNEAKAYDWAKTLT